MSKLSLIYELHEFLFISFAIEIKSGTVCVLVKKENTSLPLNYSI